MSTSNAQILISKYHSLLSWPELSGEMAISRPGKKESSRWTWEFLLYQRVKKFSKNSAHVSVEHKGQTEMTSTGQICSNLSIIIVVVH